MLDQTQWPTGKQFTIVTVTPPPADRSYVLYQVVLNARDGTGASAMWCQTHTVGAPPLQAQDVVAVTGTTLSSVLVERVVQGIPNGARYLLVIPDYETNFDVWAQQQAEALRARQWELVDVAHLAEEVEELRKTERRAVRSQLRLILSHLLKWVYEPGKRTDSWRSTIANGRVLVQEDLEDSPSLAHGLSELFAWAYPRARHDAAEETGLPLATFPEACPWSIEQVLDGRFWPDAVS